MTTERASRGKRKQGEQKTQGGRMAADNALFSGLRDDYKGMVCIFITHFDVYFSGGVLYFNKRISNKDLWTIKKPLHKVNK